MTMKFDIPEDVVFTVHEPEIFNEDKQFPEWYCWDIPDLIATLEYKGTTAEIRTCGEMKICAPEGAVIRYSNAFADYDIKTDSDITAAIESGEWYYDMNNWFEVWVGEFGYDDAPIADDMTNAIEIAIRYLKKETE